MKRIGRVKSTAALAALLVLLSPALSRAWSGADEVNVMIGTGGAGFGVGSTYPGPCVPYGMARPGPDTSFLGLHPSFHHCGGYYHGDNMIRGFSHTRLSGIGVADYGNVRLMPTLNRAKDYSWEGSYTSLFSHRWEEASPGYYSVLLLGSGIKVELTATAHGALHRYTFPRGPGRLVIDADRAVLNKDSGGGEVVYDEAHKEFTGKTVSLGGLSGRNGPVEIFFAVRLDRPLAKHGSFKDGAGAWAEFAAGPEDPVTVRVGLSFISVEQARRHVDEELAGRDFDLVRAAAAGAWDEILSQVYVTGGTSEQRRIFYSALYHSRIMPTDFTEAGGLYRGFDEQVHEAGAHRYYTDFSLWDTFRTQHPLLTLIDPQRATDMMQSLTLMAEQGGYLPRWPTAYRYTNCMIGANADNVLAEAYLKGLRDFDYEKAYAASRWLALHPTPEDSPFRGRAGILDYIKLGYVPADAYGSSASWTIEMSYNDWCLAHWARALGKDADARIFEARSGNWRNLWDPATGYLRGRNRDGSFAKPFRPSIWTDYYVEGNARQWRWAPLHDPQGLIELMGGKEQFAARLEDFFEQSTQRPDTLLWDTFYWHGNEPDIHAAYLFLFADRPDLTQKWVRWAMAEKYKDAPDGLDGNDDCGTLSAWYVFSALGFYPVAGSDRYLIGSPIFDRAEVRLPGGMLTVRAEGQPGKNIYVKSVTLNGEPLTEPWFRHDQIASGGDLVFEMSAGPTEWGRGLPKVETKTGALPSPNDKFIDWASLHNPILSRPDRMLKDEAVVEKDGEFYIFASTRFADDDTTSDAYEQRFYRTRDFLTYEEFFDPDLVVTFDNGRHGGVGSPDVIRAGGVYYLVYQAGPDDRFRRLYYSTSTDLMDWAPARELVPDLQPRMRHIDGALAFDGGRFILGYKGGQKFYVTESAGAGLDRWSKPRRASAGGAWAENFQFINLDGVWRILATARPTALKPGATYTGNHEPYLYTMNGDWSKWSGREELVIPREDWNRVMHANSAYLCDWRDRDGYYYLFYAGADDGKSFQGRGHGKIGMARSRDLKEWKVAGER